MLMECGGSGGGDLYPTAYSIDNLTFEGCTYVRGGYVKVGNIVIINMRINPTTNDMIYIRNLPAPISGNVNSVSVCDIQEDVITQTYGSVQIVGSVGAIYVKVTNINKDHAISAVYISA